MKIFIYTIIFCFVFVLFSCRSRIDKNNDCEEIGVVIKTKLINTSINCSDVFSNMKEIRVDFENDSLFMYVLNDLCTEISVFAYKCEEINYLYTYNVPPVIVDSSIVDDRRQTLSICPLNNDSIVLIRSLGEKEQLVCLYNPKKNILDTLFLNDCNSVYFYSSFKNDLKNYVWDESSGSIILQSAINDFRQSENRRYKPKFLTEFDIVKRELNFVDVFYPKEYNKYGHVSLSQSIYFEKIDNNIYVSFPFFEKILIYDKSNVESKWTDCGTPYQNDVFFFSYEELKANPELQQICYSRSFRYTTIIYNEYDERFYRFYELGQNEKNEKGEYTIIGDKIIGCVVYDKSFSYVGDMHLGTRAEVIPFYKTITPTPEGLMFFSSYSSGNNLLRISLIELYGD